MEAAVGSQHPVGAIAEPVQPDEMSENDDVQDSEDRHRDVPEADFQVPSPKAGISSPFLNINLFIINHKFSHNYVVPYQVDAIKLL